MIVTSCQSHNIPALSLNIQTTGAELSDCYHLCIHFRNRLKIGKKPADATLDPHESGFKSALLLTLMFRSDVRKDSMMPYLTPAIFESEGLKNRIKLPFPVRVAGRCGLR